MSRIVGIAALVIGIVLLVFAYQSSHAPLDQVSSTLTGRYTDTTMWYLIGGILLAVVGGFVTLFGRRGA